MFDGKEQPAKATKLVSLLVRARKAELDQNGALCISNLGQAAPLGKSVADWINLGELRCALIPDKKNHLSESSLSRAIAKVQSQLALPTKSAVTSMIRSAYAKALLELASLQLVSNRRATWQTIDKLDQFKEALSTEDRARLYQLAGELAFVEQNLLAAQDFFSRSLQKDSPELRTKLQSIRTTLIGKQQDDKFLVDQPPRPSAPRTWEFRPRSRAITIA